MIDWLNIGAHALWIIGCALLLASSSDRRYALAWHRARTKHALLPHDNRRLTYTGLLLVSVGLGATSDSWWERGVWAVVCLAVLAHSLRLLFVSIRAD